MSGHSPVVLNVLVQDASGLSMTTLPDLLYVALFAPGLRRRSMIRTGLLIAAVAALLAAPDAAQVKFSSTPILQSGVTNGGGPIAYPKTDSAEVTALRVDIGPGGETGGTCICTLRSSTCWKGRSTLRWKEG
jgi:hypothetical protein